MYLSKSKYAQLWQCPKILWLDAKHPELRREEASVQARKTAGSEVGDLAKGLFGDFTEVTVMKDGRPDTSAMICKTQECIAAGVENICEASFSYNGLYCAVDILRAENGGRAIYEVKSSTGVHEQYGIDIAYQKYVLEHCGVNVTGTYLVYINSDYVRGEELDVTQLFQIVDMSDWVELETPNIPDRLKLAETVLDGDAPCMKIGEHCSHPYDCAYWGYCARHLPKPSVFDVYRLSEKKKWDYYRKGVVSFSALSCAPGLNEKQRRQIQFGISDCGTYID